VLDALKLDFDVTVVNERKGSAEPVMFREDFMTGLKEWDYSVDRGDVIVKNNT